MSLHPWFTADGSIDFITLDRYRSPFAIFVLEGVEANRQRLSHAHDECAFVNMKARRQKVCLIFWHPCGDNLDVVAGPGVSFWYSEGANCSDLVRGPGSTTRNYLRVHDSSPILIGSQALELYRRRLGNSATTGTLTQRHVLYQ